MKTITITALVLLALLGAAQAHGSKKVCHQHGTQTTHCHP